MLSPPTTSLPPNTLQGNTTIHLLFRPSFQYLIRAFQLLPILQFVFRWLLWNADRDKSTDVVSQLHLLYSWQIPRTQWFVQQVLRACSFTTFSTIYIFPLIHCVQKVPGLFLLLNLSDKLAGHELHHPDVPKNSILSTNSSHTPHAWSPHKYLLKTGIKIEVFIKIQRC